MSKVAQDVILKQISVMRDELSRLEQTVKDYFLWLDTRSPTQRAAVQSEQERTVDEKDGPVHLKRVYGSHFVEIPKPSDPNSSDGS